MKVLIILTKKVFKYFSKKINLNTNLINYFLFFIIKYNL
jgi:hypothetical protein